MEIDDTVLALGSILFELGLPIVLTVLYLKSPSKKYLLFCLSSLVPNLFFYLVTTAGYLLHPTKDNTWSFFAMWEMSFILYLFTALLSITVGYGLKKHLKIWWVAILGVFVSPFSFILLNYLPL